MRALLLASTFALSATAWSPLASGQTCDLAADINQTVNSVNLPSNPGQYPVHEERGFVRLGTRWYFPATTVATGRELHSVDLAGGSQSLFVDLAPGQDSSSPAGLLAHNGRLWFTLFNGLDVELWSSDGTALGTSLLSDFAGDPTASMIRDMTPLGNSICFTVGSEITGRELWISDGTDLGTHLLVDIRPGSAQSNPRFFVPSPVQGELLFSATDGSQGIELWKTDGTVAGTSIVHDIRPGTKSSNPTGLTPFQGAIYFSATDGQRGRELWKTDGTALGTSQVADIVTGSAGSNPKLGDFAELNGELYFQARKNNGTELFKTDGTQAGTVEVADIATPGNSLPSQMTSFAGFVYFSADDQGPTGRELWRTDGSSVGTTRISDFISGPDHGLSVTTNFLTVANGHLIMRAQDHSKSQTELWTTDGLVLGPLADITPGLVGSSPLGLTAISPTQILFSADDSVHGAELWTTDGTSAGTQLLVDIEHTVFDNSSNPDHLHNVDGQFALFTANDGVHGEELFRWDATSGAVLLLDINPGPVGSSSNEFYTVFIAGKLQTFFQADDGVHGKELWVTDGTSAGTKLFKDLNPGPSPSTPARFYYHPTLKAMFFAAEPSFHTGYELFTSDGTGGGTNMLLDLYPGLTTSQESANSGDPKHFVAFGGKLVFSGRNDKGNEPWISDGTVGGTQMIVDLLIDSPWDPSPPGSRPRRFQNIGDKLLFLVPLGFDAPSLFVTDGTSAGTQQLGSLVVGESDAQAPFGLFNGLYYFAGKFGDDAYGLWKTDGTAAGTSLVLPDVYPTELTVSGGKLFFISDSLWVFDGSGAVSVTPVVMGVPPEHYRVEMVAANGGVFFGSYIGDDSDGITTISFNDGSTGGTTQLCAFETGYFVLAPRQFTMVADQLLFAAQDQIHGFELMAIDHPGANVQGLGTSGNGAHLSATAPLLGQTMTISVTDSPVGDLGLLMVSQPFQSPGPGYIAPTSMLWVDPLGYSLLSVFSGSELSLPVAVPSGPSLAGALVHLQAAAIPATGVPISTSNGLLLVLGN